MTTKIGIGFSQATDTEEAARTASLLSKENLHADQADIALIFSTIDYNPKRIIPGIQEILGETKLIGCSSAGIILSDKIETRGISVLTIKSDEVKFGIGSVTDLDKQDTHRAGNLLARNTLANSGRHDRHAFIYFVDGNLENNSLLLKGIQETLGNLFPILGAGSCDDFHFSKTFQISQDAALTNAAIGLIIGGHANITVSSRHGWRPLGKPRTIDKAEGNIIKVISGKKASSLYQEYFGDEAESLRSNQFGQMSILYPLGIYVEGSHEYLLRKTADILPDGSIVCQGDIPEGAEIHIMIGNKDSCKQAAVEAAEEVKSGLSGKTPKLIMILESMARLKLLGRHAYKEIENIKNILGPEVPIIGMYANGETCPLQTTEKFIKPYFLNESIVILAIS